MQDAGRQLIFFLHVNRFCFWRFRLLYIHVRGGYGGIDSLSDFIRRGSVFKVAANMVNYSFKDLSMLADL